MGNLLPDIRYAIRTLAKSPGFTAAAVLTLALGIGANSVIFSGVNAVLLRPLPFSDPDRLVWITEFIHKLGIPNTFSPANFLDLREQTQIFEYVIAFDSKNQNLTGATEPERIEVRRVSPALFPLLGAEAIVGRTFLAEEEEPGSDRVAVISHGLWQRRFGGDADLIGKPILLDGQAFTVVGILTAEAQLKPVLDGEIWVPRSFDERERQIRGLHYLSVLGRLKAGVTVEEAQAEVDSIARRLEQENPESNTDVGIVLTPFRERLVEKERSALIILFAAVGFVLLIACINVANLLLSRAETRKKEIAIRSALGASRHRVIRQLLTESALLAGLGGALGLLVAFWGLDLLAALRPSGLRSPLGGTLGVDRWVVVFTLGISSLTAMLCGLLPACQASRSDLNEALKEGGRQALTLSARPGFGKFLVVSEVGLALVLLIGAGLMSKSLIHLYQVDPGFDPASVLTVSLSLPEAKYPERQHLTTFCRELLRRVEVLPGVKFAGIINKLPLSPGRHNYGFRIEGRPEPKPWEQLPAEYRKVSPDYFRALGIAVLMGRGFSEADTDPEGPRVAVINQTLARLHWPDESPVGMRLTYGPLEFAQWIEIIGVAEDVKQFGLNAEVRPVIYTPLGQAAHSFFQPERQVTLVMQTDLDPMALA
ncbi:MAG: ABC transporter permease, partial [Acidobacteriota bacterium]